MDNSNFFFPTLKHASMVAVITPILKQDDVGDALKESVKDDKFLKKAETAVNSKIEMLSIPKAMKAEMCTYTIFILAQMREWLVWRNLNFNEIPCEIFLNASFLTNKGTYDEKKSTEAILKNDSISAGVRFKLACICCSEKYVEELWDKLSCRRFPSAESWQDLKTRIMYDFVRYWACKMQRKKPQYTVSFLSPAESETDLFMKASGENFGLAVEYLWNKFSLSEKKQVLRCDSWFWRNPLYWPDSYIRFLYSAWPYVEQQKRIKSLRLTSFRIMKVLLQWPYVLVFDKAAEKFFEHIYGDDYILLIHIITELKKKNSFIYDKLLQEFLVSESLQKSLFNEKHKFCQLIFQLLENDNVEEAELLVRKVFSDPESLLFSDEFFLECCVVWNSRRSLYSNFFCKLITFVCDSVLIGKRKIEWIEKFVVKANIEDEFFSLNDADVIKCSHLFPSQST